MHETIKQYLDKLFAAYDGTNSVAELKGDLLADLNERYDELTAQGKDEAAALAETLDSIGDMEEILGETAASRNTQVLVHFNAQELGGSDFAGVTLHGGKFEASSIRHADFSDADLTGSSFKNSDVQGANFDRANLTDCNLSVLDLRESSFHESVLVRTNFATSGLDGAKFVRVKLIDVNFSMIDLRKVHFTDCVIDGGTFKYADLRGLCFDGQTIRNVDLGKCALEGVSLQKATLQNVSFAPPFTISKKYYKAIKTIRFDGASMDKLTYNALKGLGADLSDVKIF